MLYVPMNYCHLGQLVPSATLARYVLFMPIGPIGSTGPIGAYLFQRIDAKMGQLVPSAQLAPDVLFMPNGPIGSTGPIGAICPNELMPSGPIDSVRPIGAVCTIYANWANWFHGPNWCGMSQ